MCERYEVQQFFYFHREWLNRPGEGTAFIEAEIEKPSKNSSWYDGGGLTIKDCNRQVNISFPVQDTHSRENSLRKIAIIFETVSRFQTHLLHVADLAEKAEIVREAAREAKRIKENNVTELGDDECMCPSCLKSV